MALTVGPRAPVSLSEPRSQPIRGETIPLSSVPSSETAWLPPLVVTRWYAALPFYAPHKRDVACAWLVRDAVVPHSVYGLKYEKRQSVFTLLFGANLWHPEFSRGHADRQPVRSGTNLFVENTTWATTNTGLWVSELEIAIASRHESLVKALTWQIGNRFSPPDREL